MKITAGNINKLADKAVRIAEEAGWTLTRRYSAKTSRSRYLKFTGHHTEEKITVTIRLSDHEPFWGKKYGEDVDHFVSFHPGSELEPTAATLRKLFNEDFCELAERKQANEKPGDIG